MEVSQCAKAHSLHYVQKILREILTLRGNSSTVGQLKSHSKLWGWIMLEWSVITYPHPLLACNRYWMIVIMLKMLLQWRWAAKSFCMVVGKLVQSPSYSLYLRNALLPWVSSILYLAVYVGEEFIFQHRLNYASNFCGLYCICFHICHFNELFTHPY